MISPTAYVLPTTSEIEPRKFLCGPVFQEGQISLTIASGGVGKTTLCIADAVSMAGGLSLMNGEPSQLKVWFISAEEDNIEMDRRIAAACQVGHAERPHFLYVDCVTRNEIQIASSDNGVNEVLVDHLVNQISNNDIKIVIVDPFICTHSVSENDNVKIDKVARAWRHIAIKAKCAVHIIHHQSKSIKPGADGARGASALRDAARFVRTLERLEKADIERLKLPPTGKYIRINVTKSNYDQAEHDDIVEIINHTLMNGPDLGSGPTPGDKVGVIKLHPIKDLWANRDAAGSAKNGSYTADRRKNSPRTDPPTAEEIDIILDIAAKGRFKSGAVNWIGTPIAAALGLTIRSDRGWIDRTIDALVKSNRLNQWNGPRTKKSGAAPQFLKPAGYTETTGQADEAEADTD